MINNTFKLVSAERGDIGGLGSLGRRHGHRSALRGALVAALLVLSAVPTFAQLTAPNAKATVAAVIAAHSEIDSCDEIARAAIVDYAAQRLNRGAGREVWGRKSRGKPTHAGIASNPNTDGLTFLRPDGKFEIYDVISGAPPCGASWDGFGPFAQGENGWWAPPQLGDEPGASTPPPPPPPPPPDDTRLRALEQRVEELAARLSQADQRLSARIDAIAARPVDLSGLQSAIDAAIANLWVCGKTERDRLGLQHRVCLGLTKR